MRVTCTGIVGVVRMVIVRLLCAVVRMHRRIVVVEPHAQPRRRRREPLQGNGERESEREHKAKQPERHGGGLYPVEGDAPTRRRFPAAR